MISLFSLFASKPARRERAALEALARDVERRKALVGIPYAKRRDAAFKATRG